MKRAAFAIVATALVLGFAARASAGTVTVGSNSTFDLGTGSLALGCADLAVAGTLTAGTVGFSAARDVAINPGGTMNGNSALLSLSGNWDNSGTFNAGTSTVQMVDGCALFSGVISGNTTFANLSMNTSTAKQVSITASSTQSVTGLLTLIGTLGNRLKIRSTLAGTAAIFNVTGSSNVAFVDVQDNNALPGNDISLPANSLKGSNTPGWLQGISVPLLGPVGIALLSLLLLVSGQRWLSRSTRAGHTV
jgi:hypothetical protein